MPRVVTPSAAGGVARRRAQRPRSGALVLCLTGAVAAFPASERWPPGGGWLVTSQIGPSLERPLESYGGRLAILLHRGSGKIYTRKQAIDARAAVCPQTALARSQSLNTEARKLRAQYWRRSRPTPRDVRNM